MLDTILEKAKELLCTHDWEYMGTYVFTSDFGEYCYKEVYRCRKCLKEKYL